MATVEELKAAVDQLTPDERGKLNPQWHPDWSETEETRVRETPEAQMSPRVRELKKVIDALSFMEKCELNALVHDWLDDEWDKQMRADSEPGGKLDKLFAEVERARREGTLRPFPPVEEP